MFFDFPRDPSPTGPAFALNVGVVCERKRQHELLAVLETLREEGLSLMLCLWDFPLLTLVMPLIYARLEQANRKHGGFEHIPKLDEPAFCRLFAL